MRKLARGIAALVLPVVLVALSIAWAQGAHAAQSAAAIFEYDSIAGGTGTCLVANGDAIYTQSGCSTDASSLNHAALWYLIDMGTDSNTGLSMWEFENVHYQVCITITGTSGAYGAPCGSNHVQWWEYNFTGNYEGGFPVDALANVHTHDYLYWETPSSTGTGQTTNGSSPNSWWAFDDTGV